MRMTRMSSPMTSAERQINKPKLGRLRRKKLDFERYVNSLLPVIVLTSIEYYSNS
jgi:hypothetical protein